MSVDPIASVQEGLAKSDLVRAVAAIRADGGRRFALGDGRSRNLLDSEEAELQRLGNVADDWNSVLVSEGFDTSRVRSCTFHGEVLIGCFTETALLGGGLRIPSGLVRSTIANCIIGNGALVQDVRLLANYVVGPGAILFASGTIACCAPTDFGNGKSLPLGIQSGGREVPVFAEIDVETAAFMAAGRGRREMFERYQNAVAGYVAAVRSERGVIERHARICNTATVRNVYVGPHAIIDGATLVADSTLLSSESEPARVESGACVSSAIMQWGSGASTHAVVERSVLTDHVHVEQHGKVIDSILGPNTAVGSGEGRAGGRRAALADRAVALPRRRTGLLGGGGGRERAGWRCGGSSICG